MNQKQKDNITHKLVLVGAPIDKAPLYLTALIAALKDEGLTIVDNNYENESLNWCLRYLSSCG